MRDPRIDRLADVLVNYSTEVREGDTVSISGEQLAQPLLLAVYEEVLRAGGHPVVNVGLDGAVEAFYDLASDRQLDVVSPVQELIYGTFDVTIGIQAPTNSRSLTHVDPEKQARVSRARHPLMTTYMERAASGALRWVGTVFPTEMVAADAEMSLRRYEDLFFAACLCDRDDPVAAWRTAAAETHRLNDWMNDGRSEVRIEGPGTDLTISGTA
jgi:aminopeptidase